MKKLSQHCKNLLNESLIYEPTYRDGLSNHLPMTLIALDYLGASEKKMTRFYSSYKKRLTPFKKNCQFSNRTAYYSNVINQLGCNSAVSQSIEELMPSISASAFHCLIRLAYALESGIPNQVAAALSYWNIEFYSLGGFYETKEVVASEVIQELLSDDTIDPPKNRLIIDNLQDIANMERFDKYRYIPNDISITKISDLALKIYLASNNNFTCLHLLTSCHALRIVTEIVTETKKKEILNYYWLSMIFAIVSVKDKISYSKFLEECEFADINGQENSVETLDDDHDIKTLYSCLEEYKVSKDQRYYLAISARLPSK